MCGRFAMGADLNDLIEAFVADGHRFSEWVPRWNIAPTSTIPLVIDLPSTGKSPERLIGPARWSLTPSWSPTLELPYPTFNARSETVGEKPTFRPSLATQRGLIPAECFYEWHQTGGVKVPYCVRPVTSRFFAFAALYSVWTNPQTQEKTTTATILTQDATEPLAWLHDRQPVMVPESLWSTWLDPTARWTQGEMDRLVEQAGEQSAEVEVYQVAPLRGEGPQLMERSGDSPR